MANKFLKDKSIGEQAEHEFITILYTLNIPARRNTQQKNPAMRGWDVEDLKWGYKYEIKNDVLYNKTGNVYVEHKSILNCQSDFVVYKLGPDFYKVPTLFLVDRMFFGGFKEVTGGDQNAFGTLINGEEFKWLSQFVGNIITSGQLIEKFDTTPA